MSYILINFHTHMCSIGSAFISWREPLEPCGVHPLSVPAQWRFWSGQQYGNSPGTQAWRTGDAFMILLQSAQWIINVIYMHFALHSMHLCTAWFSPPVWCQFMIVAPERLPVFFARTFLILCSQYPWFSTVIGKPREWIIWCFDYPLPCMVLSLLFFSQFLF
jgi:hypothetical protein